VPSSHLAFVQAQLLKQRCEGANIPQKKFLMDRQYMSMYCASCIQQAGIPYLMVSEHH